MAIRELFYENEQAARFFSLVQKGEKKGMDYFYRNSFDSLLNFGKTLIKEEFIITCILHECYLKAWANRERMESLAHIYRFVRMNLRWQILRYIEKSSRTTHGQTIFIDYFEKAIGDFADLEEDLESWEEYNHKLQKVNQSIQYLSPEAQKIVALYFQKGLTHKQIAGRLGKTPSQISTQIQKSIKQLKRIVHLSLKKTDLNNTIAIADSRIKNLDFEQSKIYELRKNQKLPFDDIAKKLGLSLLQVQNQYIKAHKILQI